MSANRRQKARPMDRTVFEWRKVFRYIPAVMLPVEVVTPSLLEKFAPCPCNAPLPSGTLHLRHFCHCRHDVHRSGIIVCAVTSNPPEFGKSECADTTIGSASDCRTIEAVLAIVFGRT